MNPSFIQCRTSKISKFGLFASFTIYPLVGVVLAFLPLLLFREILLEEHTTLQLIILIISIICSISMSAILINMSRKVYIMESRSVAFDQSGFEIKYQKNGVSKRYDWQEVCEIGIVVYAANANRQNYQTQICFFLKPVDDTTLKKLRDSYLYGINNLDCIILFDYDPFIVEILNELIGPNIHDFRAKQKTL